MRSTPTLQRVITEIAARHGQDMTKNPQPLSLELPGYMRLCIERISLTDISVAHYFLQNGDLCADPDVTLRISEVWTPLTFQMPNRYDDYTDGSKMRGQADLASFCELWARNLEAQGWMTRSTLRKEA
jgi:hypothetical protein